MKTMVRAVALLAALSFLAPAGAVFAGGTDSIADDEEQGASAPESPAPDDQDEISLN